MFRRVFPLLPFPWMLVLILFVLGAAIAQAELPDVAQLPSRPDLPDPLVMLDGERITTKEQWLNKRRPELKELFQHYMYGYLPAAPDKIECKIDRKDGQSLGGKATLKEVTIGFGSPEVPQIHLLLVVPNKRTGPAPVFLGMNFAGNHTVLQDPHIRLPTSWMAGRGSAVKNNRATESGRGTQVDVWDIEASIDRGYAVATLYYGDVVPDHPGAAGGIQPYFHKKGMKNGPHDWGAIAVWAWGLQRAVDCLAADNDIDKKRIAVVGHSRLGKTALLAAAFDERIALAIPHQAGCGGTSPSRGKIGESVKQINDRFPHWFDATFKEFNDRPDRLPFDQHCLIALVAPRPVLLTNGVEDTWANPQGQFQMLQAADPVYRLLGAGGLEAKEMPPIGKLIDSTLGYYIRPGVHSMGKEDWQIFRAFADKHFGK
jgi:hypothetical protein